MLVKSLAQLNNKSHSFTLSGASIWNNMTYIWLAMAKNGESLILDNGTTLQTTVECCSIVQSMFSSIYTCTFNVMIVYTGIY